MSVPASQFKRDFLASVEAAELRRQLDEMTQNPVYNTQECYKPNQAEGLSFADKHITYLSEHPKLKPAEYMSNLRLMTKARTR